MAAIHKAYLRWLRGHQLFTDNHYSRRYTMGFEGGAELEGSSSPLVVPEPMSDAQAVDPEEMLVAATAGCHMLWFLDLARQAGFCIDSYRDAAEGKTGRNSKGRVAVTRITLRPEVIFKGELPSEEHHQALHRRAHDACFIANSLLAEVLCLPSMTVAPHE